MRSRMKMAMTAMTAGEGRRVQKSGRPPARARTRGSGRQDTDTAVLSSTLEPRSLMKWYSS